MIIHRCPTCHHSSTTERGLAELCSCNHTPRSRATLRGMLLAGLLIVMVVSPFLLIMNDIPQ